MSSLYLQLPPGPVTAATEFDWLLSPDGRTVGSHGSGAAATLPAPTGAGAEVVAVAPAGALSWHRVDLPKGVGPGSSRLRQVLEGLLEDQLLDEPESLHFALEPQPRPGTPAWVAVCQRAWLREALQALEAAGRPASRVVPEVAPEAPASLHVLGEPEQAAVIASGPEGVLILPLSAGARSLLPELPEDAPCFAEPAVSAQAEQLLQRPVVLQTAPQRWMQAAQSRWDLAQFEFASSPRARRLRKLATGFGELLHARQWRPARWGLALLVLANLVGVNAWAWKERAALAAKQQAVREIVTTTFPHVRVVVDPPVQMAREVAMLRQATGAPSERDLEHLLGALAAAAPGRTVSGLDYNGSTLSVRGLGWTPAQLQAAQAVLHGHGLGARLEGQAVVLAPEGTR